MRIYVAWAVCVVLGTLAWFRVWPNISEIDAFLNAVAAAILLGMLGSAGGYALAHREGEKTPDPLRVASATAAVTLALLCFAIMIAGQP
jgi:hypothetical protein